jgi:hypothetical protein
LDDCENDESVNSSKNKENKQRGFEGNTKFAAKIEGDEGKENENNR